VHAIQAEQREQLQSHLLFFPNQFLGDPHNLREASDKTHYLTKDRIAHNWQPDPFRVKYGRKFFVGDKVSVDPNLALLVHDRRCDGLRPHHEHEIGSTESGSLIQGDK
jgi:hypothetical protein